MATYWNEKRYHTLDYDMKAIYGEKVYRITLSGGMTCPNRDGTVGQQGCLFCGHSGSGDFAGDWRTSIREQLARGKAALRCKRPVKKFIAYFQAFSNTYAPVSHLRDIFTQALSDPDVVILSIATRPDCLGPEVLALLEELNRRKPVWIELGLQTIHPQTSQYIRSGFTLDCYEQAVKNLRSLNIPVITHVILYLPGETSTHMEATISYLNRQDIQGIKLHLLHVLSGTDLAMEYRNHPFHLPSQEEYVAFLCHLIAMLRPDMTIHRLTGDGPKDLLMAPAWSSRKRDVLNAINRHMKAADLWQGKHWPL